MELVEFAQVLGVEIVKLVGQIQSRLNVNPEDKGKPQ